MLTLADFPTAPFTPADAASSGIARWDLRAALDAGAVRRVLRGVYVRSDQPDTIENRCLAVGRVISARSVVRDRTAAWLLGVDVLDHHELEILPPVETSVPRFAEPTRRADHLGCTRDLGPRDVMVVHGVRVTTPLRTALDLGGGMWPRSALAAMDALAREWGFGSDDLERELPRLRRRRGVVQLRRLVPMVDARSESFGESWVRYELIAAGLPGFEPQVEVDVEGWAYRLDLPYPRHKVLVEYDGHEHHSKPEDKEHDEERRDRLRRHGWIVIVVTKDRLDATSCEEWTREVRAALRSRTHAR